MPRIRAFSGYLVAAARAAEVVSPAYDAVSADTRRAFAEAHPQNYLNTMRLREDFPQDARPGADELLTLNKTNLQRMLTDGSFEKFGAACMFVYRLRAGAHVQTGLVCEIGVDEYAGGRVRKHENTRSDKEDLLAMYQKVVGVSSSPVCLAHRDDAEIARALREITRAKPLLDFAGADGVAQQVWRVDANAQRNLSALFARIEVTYLTDGHHRAASALRYAKMMRESCGDASHAPSQQLLVALFPAGELLLLPFHRAVRDLHGMPPQKFLAALQKDFTVTPAPAPHQPKRAGEFGILLGGAWHIARIRGGKVDMQDAVASLDVSILQNHILAPLLGIRDMRSDSRLEYVSGALGLDGLTEHAAAGWAVCFACAPASIAQLMRVADAGELMPPKSTYFDPKARSGIFIRPK